MDNKKELEKQANNLQRELDKLKAQIQKCEKVDLFSIASYKELCKLTKEKELTCSDYEDEQMLAFAQIKQIQRLYNGDSKNNIWCPYFYASGGFRVSLRGGYCCGGLVGFYKDKKTSDFIGRTFESIYKKIK